MLVKPVVYDNTFQRKTMPGDVVGGAEVISAGVLATAGAGTLTAAILTTGFCVRTGPTGAYNDTTDTASNIIAALTNSNNGAAPSPGDTFRFRHLNTVAYVMTMVAGTGVTLGTVPATTIQASVWKEYLVTITNATPQLIVGYATSTSGTKVITGLTQAQTSAISVGMLVTGTNVGSSAVVTSIQPGVGVNVSVNASGTVAGTVTFSPTVRIDAITIG